MQPDIQPYVLTNSSLSLPRRTVLLALAALGLGARPAAAAETMAYRYWDWGTRRDDYQVAVLTLALEKTAAAYGPYSVTRVPARMSASRSRREVHEGRLMNVYVAPWRDINAGPEDERSHQISTPILGGLLGYRWLVVRKEDLPQFQAISNAAQLKALPAGLGRGWVDVSVLRHNGYRVEDSGNMPTLLDMLINKRFAYLPFGAIETAALLESHPQQARELAVVPDMVMYYPLPSIFYVSPSQPRLAERVEAGLAAAKRDGSLDELTARHFQKEIKQLKASSNRYFVLANPLLPKAYVGQPTLVSGKTAP